MKKFPFLRKISPAAAGPLPPNARAESTSSPKIDSGSAPPSLMESPQVKRFDRNSQSSAHPADKLELQVLVEPTSSVDSTNIVFIHGLGGTSCGTWTNEGTNFFWPASLPKAMGLEDLRVMTFGYNATWQSLWKVWHGKPQLDIADFSSQLLNSLRLQYYDCPDVDQLSR